MNAMRPARGLRCVPSLEVGWVDFDSLLFYFFFFPFVDCTYLHIFFSFSFFPFTFVQPARVHSMRA